MNRDPIFRRAKSDPCADFWHTVRFGAAIFAIILIAGLIHDL
jgi:hypothetical protein